MYTVHVTKKLLDRLKTPVTVPGDASTSLGNWYATSLMWRPQVAVFVNTATFFPVFARLAPAATVLERFPDAACEVWARMELDPRFVHNEISHMTNPNVAKTADRQVLGVMNELAFMAHARIGGGHNPNDLVGLSIRVADTLISPLYKDRAGTPDRELRHHIDTAVGDWPSTFRPWTERL